MNTELNNDLKPSPEQKRYAKLLFMGAWISIFLLIFTYSLYVIGVISPHVDINTVTQHWNKGVAEYLEITNCPEGWGWLSLIFKGDYLNFVGLTVLALMTIICYLSILPSFVRKKDWIYSVICFLEILVLCIAASGILGAGGH